MALSGTGPFVTAFKQKKIVITYRLVRTVKSGISKRAAALTLIRLWNPAVSSAVWETQNLTAKHVPASLTILFIAPTIFVGMEVPETLKIVRAQAAIFSL